MPLTRKLILLPLFCVVASGCVLHSPKQSKQRTNPTSPSATSCLSGTCVADYDQLREPVEPACYQPNPLAAGGIGPRSIDTMPENFWDLTLDQAVHLALQNSDVLRDLGGRVLSAPESVQTKYNPGIEYTDPFFGVEAALSAFDATLDSQFSYALNDRVFNNTTLGGGATELQQDLSSMQTELSKLAATGTLMSLRSAVAHDRNNRIGNLFGHVWESQMEAEIRQPLLQGAGLGFNRIAGPNAAPGLRFSNGVVLAQMNNDISKVDFEVGVRNLVSGVVDAYWQLYRAYHDFDAKQSTRVAAEDTWKAIQAKYERGLIGGEADKEAQARAQYYLYQDLSIEALNGSDGAVGVYEAERRLRLLMGLGVNDGNLLRPVDEVSPARVLYDWPTLSPQAIQRRAEIRKQRWVVKQEELRLVAAKNFVLPRLDATALYRLRGFGDDLAGRGDGGRFASAGRNLGNLDHQEWEFGLQFNVPIGRRRAYAGVRHAELRLCRERGVLREQELFVSHELANAIGRDEQTHASMTASYERMLAAQQRLEATEASYDADQVPLDLLLEAQERLGSARSRYYQLVAAHAIAEKNVQLSGGNLLGSFGVRLQGDCPTVFCSAPQKRRDQIDYRFQVPCRTTAGLHFQQTTSDAVSSTPLVEATRPVMNKLDAVPELRDVNELADSDLQLAPVPNEMTSPAVPLNNTMSPPTPYQSTRLPKLLDVSTSTSAAEIVR